jgi:hypothetical protein
MCVGRGTQLAVQGPVQQGRKTVVSVVLTTRRPGRDGATVTSTIEFDLDDPRWTTWLVDAITGQAREGARQLRDQLSAQQGASVPEFVPLAAILPAATAEPSPTGVFVFGDRR